MPDQHEQIQVNEIDFSKYRTDELLSEIGDLIYLPNVFLGFCKMVLLGIFVFLSVLWAVAELKGLETIALYTLAAWSIAAGLVGGFFLGLAELVRKSLEGVTKIVGLLVRLTGQVVADQRLVSTGSKKLPPPREMMRQCYEKAVLPSVEAVVKRRFSVLGRMGFWVYRMTLGQAVRTAIRYVPIGFLESRSQISAEKLHSNVETAYAESEELLGTFQSVETKLASAGNTLTHGIMLPAYGVVALVLLLLSQPYLLIVFVM